ncbi:EAL domain-containing protein [Sphingomonas pokkalii]|uniref:EAL domain-containing protein n=1 Tax=Sphingomonas pokkalii TaxID=2175090 RepID=UPI001F0BDD23|nr:EAL domain-containing protein [Sphingomonas pokkalii]
MQYGWNVSILCRVLNFETVRRNLGRERLERAVDDVVEGVLSASLPLAIVSHGRGLLEFSGRRQDFDAALDVVHAVRAQVLAGEQSLALPARIDFEFGMAAGPEGECDPLQLVEAAEAALARAREEGGLATIDLSRDDRVVDRLMLIHDLPRAIELGEMVLHYQPKVHVRRQAVASAEALVRWNHPVRGLILPGDFIAAAEQSGQIAPLTLWTLRQVIADQQAMAAAGHDLPLFLNISGMLLADSDFVREACAIITAHPQARLGFEITETAVIRDPECAIRHLQQFADHGVALAIDDYGAGLSSLAYLKQLPAKELKIDKMFITQLTSSHRDPLIVRSTIDLAHALEMEVTAEGVETPAALALLSVMGCDLVQGYLISRPVPLPALIAYLGEQERLAETLSSKPMFLRSEGFWKRV